MLGKMSEVECGSRFKETIVKSFLYFQKTREKSKVAFTPTPWLTLLLVLGKSRVKQNSC